MLTTVMTLGKQDIYLSCGHRIRLNKLNPMHLKVNQLFDCKQCNRGKPLHGKPLKQTVTWKANHD